MVERWPALLVDPEASLLLARRLAQIGELGAARRLLRQAEEQARRELGPLDGWFVVWPEWARFQEACALDGWAAWLPVASVVLNRIGAAQLALLILIAKAERILSGVAPKATTADAFEDLLVQVWRCEREWRLDDRIDVALGVPRTRQARPGETGSKDL